MKKPKKDIFNNIKLKNKKLKIIQTKKLRNVIQPLEEEYKDSKNIIINGDEEHVVNPKDMNDLRNALNEKQKEILDKDIEIRNKTVHKEGEDQKAYDLLKETYDKNINEYKEKIDNKKKQNNFNQSDSKLIKRWEDKIKELEKDFQNKRNENDNSKIQIQIKKSNKK